MRRPPWTRDRLVVTATLAAAAASVGLVVVPLVKLGQIMADDGGSSIRRVLRAPGLGQAALHSLLLAIVVPLIAVPVGTAAALVLRRSDVPGRGLLRLAVVLPLVIPQFVLGYSWTQAYGRAGFTDTVLGLWWTRLDGPVGIVVVLVVDAVPLCYLLTTVGLATRAQPELERAARLSGAGGWSTMRTVTLPLLRPVLAAEVVLTFVATMESFAVPQVLGTPSGFATLTTRIYADLSLASDPDSFLDAVTLALGLVVVAAVVLVPADLVLGPRLRAVRTGQPAAAEQPARRSWRAAGPALLIAGYTLLVVGVPTLALLAAAVTRAIGLPPTPSNWTLDNFRTALDGPTVAAIGHSLQLAALAAFALTAFGVLVAALQHRGAGRALGTITILTFAIPGLRAGRRPADRLRAVVRRRARPDPDRLPGQVLGPGPPHAVRRGRPAAAGRVAGRPHQRRAGPRRRRPRSGCRRWPRPCSARGCWCSSARCTRSRCRACCIRSATRPSPSRCSTGRRSATSEPPRRCPSC